MSYEINDRILELRKALKLSQTEFGKRIGVSRGVINNIDLSIVQAKPLMIQQICKEFSVNQNWLETGDGEMFSPQTKDEELAELFGELLSDPEDNFKKRFISALLRLDPGEWDAVERFCQSIIESRDEKKEDR